MESMNQDNGASVPDRACALRVEPQASQAQPLVPSAAYEPLGTFACPICGKDTPHHHSSQELADHAETEAWVEESLQRFKELEIALAGQAREAARLVAFLEEAARYFTNRPTGGEDRAYWSNIFNAENCTKAASFIANIAQVDRSPKGGDCVQAPSSDESPVPDGMRP